MGKLFIVIPVGTKIYFFPNYSFIYPVSIGQLLYSGAPPGLRVATMNRLEIVPKQFVFNSKHRAPLPQFMNFEDHPSFLSP